MDLDLDENQRAIADLALQILRESLGRERLRAIEATSERFGEEEWKKLAAAGLLGVPLREDVGGGGFGIVEACLVLEQIGRTVAPLPYLASTEYPLFRYFRWTRQIELTLGGAAVHLVELGKRIAARRVE